MDDRKPDPSRRRIETLKEYFEKGKAFSEELMNENERLRLRLLKLESEEMALRSRFDPSRLTALLEENQRLRANLEALETRFLEVESENQDFVGRYAEVQTQNENLINLYVASYQLHSSLDPEEVVAIIQEIILNLIGALEYRIFLEGPEVLLMLAGETAEGPVSGGAAGDVDATLADVLAGGESHFGDPDVATRGGHIACVPLKVKGEVIGAISITRLLDQKTDGLTGIDREILGLLSDHAATALISADLHRRNEQTLHGDGGSIDVLTADIRRLAT